MEDEYLTEKEQITLLIDEYSKLQRILASDDMKNEIDYQLRVTKAKLESMGVQVEQLEYKTE